LVTYYKVVGRNSDTSRVGLINSPRKNCKQNLHGWICIDSAQLYVTNTIIEVKSLVECYAMPVGTGRS